MIAPSFDPIPLPAFRERILALYEPPLMSFHSHRNMRQALDHLIALLGASATTADLTSEAIGLFVKSRAGVESPNTTKKRLVCISAACGLAVADGCLARNPVAVRKRWVRTLPAKKPRVHSRVEIAGVLELARTEAEAGTGWDAWKAWRLYALAAVYCYCGLRKTEALVLQVGDVDLAERMLWLTARVGREGKTEAACQPVPMPAELTPILAGWLARVGNVPDGLPGKPHFHPYLNRPAAIASEPWLFPNVLRGGPWLTGSNKHRPHDALKALGRRAGVPGFTPASLRHSLATHAEFFGLTDVQIQRVLRHTTTSTQKHYRHAELTNMRAMVETVSFGAAAPSPVPVPTPPVPIAGQRGRTPGKTELSPAAVAELCTLRRDGWSYAELQARYQLCRASVARILAKQRREGNVD